MDPVLIGQRLRQIRLEQGIAQADLARQLAISAPYLNLLEKGRRKVKLPLLLRALELLSTDLESFMASVSQDRPDDVLGQILDDTLARTLDIEDGALDQVRADSGAAATVAALFHLYKNTRVQLDRALLALGSGRLDIPPAQHYTPEDEVADVLRANQYYFPELEARAGEVRARAALPLRCVSDQLVAALRQQFGVTVRFARQPARSTLMRAFDRSRRLLWLSPRLPEQRLKIQLAATMGLVVLDETRLHERLPVAMRHAESPRLLKSRLANYFARALLLPYHEFFDQVQRCRYQVDDIAERFQVGYEAVAQRMCSLADPARAGVPLHLLRVDLAGNITASYSATGLRIPQGYGTCPRWAVHNAFLAPAHMTRQYSTLTDGSTYFCFAKVIAQPAAGATGTTYSVGVGTRADDAHHLAYADDLPRQHSQRLAVPVGVSCRFCDRPDCNQRAAPSYRFAPGADEYRRKQNPFNPITSADSAIPEPETEPTPDPE